MVSCEPMLVIGVICANRRARGRGRNQGAGLARCRLDRGSLHRTAIPVGTGLRESCAESASWTAVSRRLDPGA